MFFSVIWRVCCNKIFKRVQFWKGNMPCTDVLAVRVVQMCVIPHPNLTVFTYTAKSYWCQMSVLDLCDGMVIDRQHRHFFHLHVVVGHCWVTWIWNLTAGALLLGRNSNFMISKTFIDLCGGGNFQNDIIKSWLCFTGHPWWPKGQERVEVLRPTPGWSTKQRRPEGWTLERSNSSNNESLKVITHDWINGKCTALRLSFSILTDQSLYN